MESFNIPIDYYNIAGKYTKSKREFKKYLKKELIFYEALHKQTLKNGNYGMRLPDRNNHPEQEEFDSY